MMSHYSSRCCHVRTYEYDDDWHEHHHVRDARHSIELEAHFACLFPSTNEASW